MEIYFMIDANGTELELSYEDAHELYNQLSKFFKEKTATDFLKERWSPAIPYGVEPCHT